jgi:Protein kinase domain
MFERSPVCVCLALTEAEVPPTRSFQKFCRDALSASEFAKSSSQIVQDALANAKALYALHANALRPAVADQWKILLDNIELKLAHINSGFSACVGLSVDPEALMKNAEVIPVPSSDWGFTVARRAFDLSIGELGLADFVFVKPIKGGAFGEVFLARHLKTGEYFAVKVLKKSHLSLKNQRDRVSSEQAILAQTANPWIVKMFYSFENKDHLFIVMEYLPGGDCLSLLEKFNSIEERLAKQYLAEAVLALEYLHSRGIIHRDIKVLHIALKYPRLGICVKLTFLFFAARQHVDQQGRPHQTY